MEQSVRQVRDRPVSWETSTGDEPMNPMKPVVPAVVATVQLGTRSISLFLAPLLVLGLGLVGCVAGGGDDSDGPGDDTGDDTGDDGGDDSPDPPAVRHGDLCVAPAFDCGVGTGLVCVIDQQGDTQGVCRAECASFSDCLDNEDAFEQFDTSCCDILNGTQVCGQTDDWPQGACS
jgi:hypothetical protein